jgi:hypothetical protein
MPWKRENTTLMELELAAFGLSAFFLIHIAKRSEST